MDPLTQGAIGAALPLSTRSAGREKLAGIVGFMAGMAADLDVLIRSSSDSLLFLEYHRQFTHSLAFIPVGSLGVALLLYMLFRKWIGPNFWLIWMFSALGYATHGLLDAATSYGTQLLWPFSDTRFAASIISIVDPLFTGPVFLLVIVSVLSKKNLWARAAMVWALAYLGVGAYQNLAATALAEQVAEQRGHRPVRLEVKPTFGNLVVWKSIYEADGRFYVDGIRPNPKPATYPGTSILKLDVDRDFPWLDKSSRQARDIERFAWFSDNFLAKAENDSMRIIDMRYSFLPTEIAPLWSIRLDKSAPVDAHAQYESHRANARESLDKLMGMIFQ
ncbi:conserved membrane protein of unknown function [Magnetospira sp. QH-2]|nr:conserved membrane protein of unknown function [Magnetospira sp. QH-2]